jgi:hypothetical protein
MVSKTDDGFGGSINLQDVPENNEVTVNVGETLTVSFKAIIGDPDFTEPDTDVSTKIFLYRNGEPQPATDAGDATQRDKTVLIDDSTSTQATETDIITGDLTTNQYQPDDERQTRFTFGFNVENFSPEFESRNGDRVETLYLRMVNTYEFTGDVTSATTSELNVVVNPEQEQQQLLDESGQDITEGPGGAVIDGEGGQSVVQSAFDDQPSFALKALEFEDGFNPKFEETGANGNPELKLNERYNRPRVAIDTAARFVEHEIIGAKKVRQRVGSDPIELSINGVCQRPRANEIDQLHRVETAQLQSERLPQNNSKIPVHIASATTEPLEDGGAADARTGELLYTFTINAVEVIEK